MRHLPVRRWTLLGAAFAAALIGTGSVAGAATLTSRAFVVNLSSYGARCDGSHDDRPALVSALNAVRTHAGGTIMIPSGTCRIVQRSSTVFTELDGPVTLRGVSSTSTLSLDTDVAGAYRELFRVSGADVIVRNLVINRARNLFGVFFNVYGSTNFALTNVVLDGRQNTIKGEDIEAVELSAQQGQRISAARLSAVTIKNSSYGLFQANETLGAVNGVTVERSTFTGNYADDLEFNAPSSSMSNITVTNSTFRDNKYTDPSAAAGTAIGFANVRGALVRNNSFSGYTYDPIHIEDRASHITIDRNAISNSFTAGLDYASLVFVINASRYIAVTNNIFDTSANANRVACIFAGAGGGTAPPNHLTITGNTFKLRPTAKDLDNYGATAVTKSGNTYVALPKEARGWLGPARPR